MAKFDPTPQQAKAINDTGHNIIVSAGAGSGKTAVLTQRVIRIIKEGTHINELLVLTFTNAAAAEMKTRIRDSISVIPELKDELALVDQSYITTFDSFALSVVKKYHYLLNISNNIAISESSIIDLEKEKIMDKVFEKYYELKPDNFIKLIKDFCVKNDDLLKSYILKVATKIDGKPDREEYINTFIDKYTGKDYIEETFNEYQNIYKDLKIAYDNSYEDLLSVLNESYYAQVEAYGNGIYSVKDMDDVIIAINNLLPKFPSMRLDEEATAIKEKYRESLKNLKEILSYGNKAELLSSIESTKPYLEIIIDIIKDYIKELHDYKAKNEIYDFQDIALLSIKILEENEFVRNELRESFKEIMIDEYQDTNDIQETFISMISNHNVYMVGDIKQSIYRFRNANPYIFMKKYNDYSNDIDGAKIDLVENFRSRNEVREGINDIFNLIMDNSIGGAEYHVSHQMITGNKTYEEEGKTNQDYHLEILEYQEPKEDKTFSDVEIEAFTIARDIKSKIKEGYQVFSKGLRKATYNDFVVLIDRGTDFNTYKKIFEYLGIPTTLHKDETLNDADNIYIIKNIIDFIVNIKQENYDTNFQYDFMSIARSYLYNYDDQTIFNYFLNNNFQESDVYTDFKDISNQINHMSIIDLLTYIINKTNMYEKLITIKDINDSITRIDKLLEVASNLSKLGYNIYTFRDYLNELVESETEMKYPVEETGVDSVKIMTIHKSKGLEFPICYYPGLYKKFNFKDLNDRISYDNRYGIVIPFFEEGIKDTYIKYLNKYHYHEEEVGEDIRKFYVALTRAKEKMIIITPKKDPINCLIESNGAIDIELRRRCISFTNLLNYIKPYINKYYKEINIDDLNMTKEYLFNKSKEKLLNSTSKPITVKEISIPSEEEQTTEHFSKTVHNLIDKNTYDNMQYGLKVHETFELIDFKNPNLDLIDDEFIKDKVNKFLHNDILKNIDKANIYKEYEFIYTKDLTEYHGIIDLMIEYDNHIDIIDYKLNNITDENYLNQLNGYKEYIEELTKKEVNIYLYSIIGESLQKL